MRKSREVRDALSQDWAHRAEQTALFSRADADPARHCQRRPTVPFTASAASIVKTIVPIHLPRNFNPASPNVLLFTCSQALTPYSVCLHDHSSCLSTPELPINTPSRIVRWGYMSVYNRAIFMFVAIHTRFQHKFQFAASLTCFLLSKNFT